MKQLYVVNFKLLPHVRHETRDGIAYLVAPVVAVRAGVLNGQFLPADEISKSVAAWDGVPLPIGHPRENNQFISANRDDIRAQCVGTFRNPSFDGFSLRGELWLNEQHARALGGDALIALERIEKGEQLEVSTAYDVRSLDPMQGVYNGQAYTGVQRDIFPDHLALLPNEFGACSWQDGCGAPRVNKDMPMTDHPKKKKGRMKALWESVKNQLMGNIEQSFDDVSHALYEALMEDMGMNGMGGCYIEDVYPDHFIYSMRGELISRPYTIDENGQATLGTDTTPVVKEVRYLPMTAPVANAAAVPAPSAPSTETTCDCPHTAEQHVNQEVPMDKKELVTKVLQAQGLAETERATLEALPEALLQKLATPTEATPEPAPAPLPPPVAPVIPVAPPTPALSADAQYLLNRQNDQATQHRNTLTAQIVANSALKAEQCATMDLSTLENLATSFSSHAHYGGRVFPQLTANQDDENTVPEPTSWFFAPPAPPASH